MVTDPEGREFKRIKELYQSMAAKKLVKDSEQEAATLNELESQIEEVDMRVETLNVKVYKTLKLGEMILRNIAMAKIHQLKN